MNIDRVRPVPLRAAGSRFGAHTTLSFAPAHLPIGARAYALSAQLRNAYPVDPPIDCHLGMLATPTSRRKMPARPFHKTGMLARQTGVALAASDPVRRLLRWLALRGAPPGNRALPDIA
jgi:hypothetical protein